MLRIQHAYAAAALQQPWSLPEPLLRSGPAGLAWWQWLGLPAVLFTAWLAGYLLSRITRAILGRVVRRTPVAWDDRLLARLGGPLTLVWSIGAARLLLPGLELPERAGQVASASLKTVAFVTFFWAVLRGVDVLADALYSSEWAQENRASSSLVPLGARIGKVLIVAVAVVAILAELGYPVASLVAGLGIGGVAVALASQKTFENLFGAFVIGADQPLREGDFVRVDDLLGTVEAIGLRSTRLRTLDRTLVTIPNGKLAEMRIESFSARDRIRLTCTIGLVYETSASQLCEVLAGLERALREHPKIWPDTVVVRFKEFASSSLDIEVMAWFLTSDWGAFQLIREQILLKFMEVVEASGSSFAFPTRTIHVAGDRRGQDFALSERVEHDGRRTVG